MRGNKFNATRQPMLMNAHVNQLNFAAACTRGIEAALPFAMKIACSDYPAPEISVKEGKEQQKNQAGGEDIEEWMQKRQKEAQSFGSEKAQESQHKEDSKVEASHHAPT